MDQADQEAEETLRFRVTKAVIGLCGFDCMKLLKEALEELDHCRVFVSSREKIAPVGLEQYDELRERIRRLLP